jgi:thioredoxin reductase (NADPH)
MEQMRAQAAHVGTVIASDTIVQVDLSRRPFKAVGDSGASYFGETMILCTGAQARWLGLPSEQRFRGFGVSACATCDGFFFRGKEVCIVGGGNTAVEEAIFLTNFATKVTLIHRRNSLRAEKIMQDRLFRNPKIEVIWDSTVTEIVGGGDPPAVSAVRIRHVKSGKESVLPVQGVFVAIGHEPATALFRGQVEMDQDGYIVTAPDSTATSIPGVFAAGDVKDKVFRQAVTAAGMGCMGALEADKFLAAHEATAAEAAE